MSWQSGKSGGRGRGWSGAGSSRDRPKHRWQDAAAASDGMRSRRRQRNRWVFTAVLALGLLGFFVWALIPVPTSQLIVLTATAYAPPFPINGWAEEDRGTLAALDKLNLLVMNESEQWNKDRSAKIDFDAAAIKRKQGRKNAPLIVYLNMHGIVNDDGEPCLLPPGAAVGDDKTWVPVARVLTEIRQSVPAPRNTLVVLDCNRVRVNWNLGILYNTFAERVQQLVEDEKTKLAGLAVITAAGPGQTSWASADFGGSAFARYLQLGLAGAADEGEIGDGDGSVSVHELARYLTREVSAWARFNRGEPQTPVLMPQDAADFHLTWALPPRKQRPFAEQLSKQERADPPVSPAALGALWTKLDTLRANDLLRFDPIACRNFEHDLLRLEELSNGGRAYHKQASEALAELDGKLSKAVEQATSRDTQRPALAGRLAISTDESWARVPRAAHTLPAAEYLGACDAAQSQQIQALWNSLLEPGDATAQSIIEQSGLRELARKLAETQFLAALRQQDVRPLWRGLDWQQVLGRRNRAERLAVPRTGKGLPGDERAHYYARYVAEHADEQRRLAEDILFVGEQNASKLYATHAAEADRLYQETGDVMDEASTAFSTLDQAYAETPYLAAWLCSPLAVELADRDERVNGELIALIKNTSALSEEINRIKNPGGSVPTFRDRANRLEANLPKLKGFLDQEVQRLIQGDAQGPAGWRAIDAALIAPLISGDSRDSLLGRRAEISKKLHEEYFASAERDNVADDDETPSYMEAIGEWRFHPLLAMLQPGDAQVEAAEERLLDWCDQSAAKARDRLQSRIDAGQFDEPAPAEAANVELHERRKYSRAEQALRSIASLVHDDGERANDPIAELRRFDIQQLLIWHARRAIDDFWEDVANPLADRPFFEQAANDFLQVASLVREDSEAAIRDEIKGQHRALQKRVEARRARMQITPSSELAIEPTAPARVSLTVAADSPPRDYPRGIAAVFLRDATRRLTGVQFEQRPQGKTGFVELPFEGDAAQQFKLALHGADSTNPALSAVSFFRGHEDAEQVSLAKRQGIRVEYEPHLYREQSISLSGERRRQLSIIFILDCSWSMTERGLMESAKDALKRMLGEIATRNRRRGEGTRVGVRFYGHRARWSNATPPKREYQTAWKPVPPNLAPSLDVETIRHLGEFNEIAAAQVGGKIDAVQGFGQTPLYVALIQALDGFEADPPDTEKLIVAITDGEDKVWEPIEIARAIPAKVIADVLEKWKHRQIPMHIVGFNIVGSTADLSEIAQKSGGRYWDVRSGAELLAKLRERLEIGGYSVREVVPQSGAVAERGEPIEAALNEPVFIANVNPPPKEFVVAFRTAEKTVTLEGGEALELVVAPDQSTPDIWAVEYPPPAAAQAFLTRGDSGGPTHYLLRVHKPVRDETSVAFRLSIQGMPTERYHFTPRPAETWVEVTPLAEDGGEEEPYVFYDRNFEPQMPVPVLEWTALDWPESADRARIKFWCKPDKTLGKPLHDVISSGGKIGGVALSAKALKENGQYRIDVVEKYDPQSRRVDALRVAFDSDSGVQPQRVVHVFDRRNHLVTHAFYFAPEARARLEPPVLSHLRVAVAAEIKDGALQLPSDAGIEVPIDDAGEFLSPTAGAGDQ